MEPLEYTLREFTPDPRVPFPTILMVGKRASGKSTLSAALASMYPNIPKWAAFCGNASSKKYWAKRFGPCGEASTYEVKDQDRSSIRSLRRIMEFQNQIVKEYEDVRHEEPPDAYSLGVIFDDVTSKRSLRRSPELEELFSNGRHLRMLIIVCVQYLKQLPPAIRTNSDYLMILYNSKQTLKILHDEYVQDPSFDTFVQLTEKVTCATDGKGNPQFCALAYSNCTRANRIDQRFFIFKFPLNFSVDDVVLGSSEWHNYNKLRFVDRDKEKLQEKYARSLKDERLSKYRERFNDRRKFLSETCIISHRKNKEPIRIRFNTNPKSI